MMAAAAATANGQLSVPPGFRFHPTDEELLYYYLRKKVSYEAIDLDVIREVDLNKLEPWDLKDKCRIGSGPQNEWYFFSHKDKKYPTGTRTNRATTAGFWKATGRDKAIHLSSNSKRIGMRKTLVFYTGRAPHGQKTDWIMHEYRLEDDHHNNVAEVQEDGWVVCRVFKKKNLVNKGSAGGSQQSDIMDHGTEHDDDHFSHHIKSSSTSSSSHQNHTNNMLQPPLLYDNNSNNIYPVLFDSNTSTNGGMHLPQLFSPETALLLPQSNFISPISLNSMDMECSHSLLRLTSMQQQQQQQPGSDWSFLDKLLASHPSNLDHNQSSQMMSKSNLPAVADHHVGVGASAHKLPFQYLGFETDILKFSK